MVDQANSKVKPPFPKLPVFNVSALILSFTGYRDDMETLLNLLSHNSAKYMAIHSNILAAFLLPWIPDTAFTEVEFGGSVYDYNKIFPDTALPHENGYFKNLKVTP